MARSPNDRLRGMIKQAGLSYESVARGIRSLATAAGDASIQTSKSNVSYWVNGGPPQPETAGYLLELLSRKAGRLLSLDEIGLSGRSRDAELVSLGLTVEGDPVETLGRLGRADIERRTLLTTAAYSVAAALPLGVAEEYADRTAHAITTGRAGAAEVEAVKDMVAMFTAIDERHGGQHGRSTVVQYLNDDVRRLCQSRFPTEALQDEMYSAAGSLAYLAGWKAYDAGEMGLAQRYYLQAFSLARQTRSPTDEAFVLRIMAHHGMDNNSSEHVLGLAEHAMRMTAGKVSPGTEALFVICRARALADCGRFAEARREADRARNLATVGDLTEMTGWASLWGDPSATVDSHTAKINARAGNHAAAEAHHAAARRRYSGTEHLRIAALSTAAEGHAQLAQGQIERACATWGLALATMAGIRSQRTVKSVKSMCAGLAQFRRRGIRQATELEERARLSLRQAT